MRADRVVLASPVLINAARQPRGLPRAAPDAGREARGVRLFSDETLDEPRARLGCREPDDDKLLETALAGGACALVAGDGDLPDMAFGQPVPILTPRAFLDALGTGRPGA